MAPSGWNVLTLADVVTFFVGGTSFLKTEYSVEGTPVLAKGDVKPFGRIEHSGRFVETEYAQSRGYRFTQPGDFLVTTRDLTTEADFLGLVARVPPSQVYLVNQGANVFQLDETKVLPRYFVYWTASSIYRSYIKSAFSGSTQIHIRKDDWLRAPIWLPPFDVQQSVATILGTLDDKIELNRRMNETLEAIAWAIFKSWFVDFDPVRAKASGEPPESICPRLGLTPDLLALFPDRLVDSGLGEIPDGWLVKTVMDICSKVTRGVTPKYEDGSGRFIINQRVNRGTQLDWSALKELSSTLDVPADCYARRWDVLVNCLGEGTLGRTHLFKGRSDVYAVDQHMSICRGSTPSVGAFLYQVLSSPSGQEKIESLKTGSTGMTMFNISKLRNFDLLWPGQTLVKAYFEIVRALWSGTSNNEEESRILTTLRDALLPRLISGELRVPMEKSIVEATA